MCVFFVPYFPHQRSLTNASPVLPSLFLMMLLMTSRIMSEKSEYAQGKRKGAVFISRRERRDFFFLFSL